MTTWKLGASRPVWAFVALLAVAVAAFAASRYTVTATVDNYDSSNNAFTLQSDGTSSAAYTTGSGVDSELTPATGSGPLYYQWGLDLTKSSRAFTLSLDGADANSIANAPFTGPMAFNGQLYSRCFTSSGALQNWTQIQPGFPDGNCAMRANFTYAGVGYSLVMSPSYPGTGSATVSCTNWSSKSKSCVAWSDSSSVAAGNLADLYQGSTLLGQYKLSFNIALTHP